MRVFLIAGLMTLIAFASPVAASQPSKSMIYTITLTYEIKNLGPSTATDVEATISLFRDWSGWTYQRVLSTQISPPEKSIENETGENEMAKATVSLGSISPGDSKTITVTQVIEVGATDKQIDPTTVGETIPLEYENFTRPVSGLWESDDWRIADKAHELTDNENNLYWKVKSIIEFVEDYLSYESQVQEHGALWAWLTRRGDCTEYTNLFIALCRAVGIPTKFVVAYGYKDEHAPNMQEMGHAFALVYLPNFDWVPVDLTWPAGVASYGMLDYFHTSFSVSGYTSPPSVGKIEISYTRTGSKPEWDFPTSSTIVREVGVDPSMKIGGCMWDRNLPISVTLRNAGRYRAENLRVEVVGNQKYFDVLPESQNIDSLSAGKPQTVDLSVHVTQDAPGLRELTARVTYDVEYAGASRTFIAENELSIAIPEFPSVPGAPMDLMLMFLAAAVVLSTVIIALIFVRRR